MGVTQVDRVQVGSCPGRDVRFGGISRPNADRRTGKDRERESRGHEHAKPRLKSDQSSEDHGPYLGGQGDGSGIDVARRPRASRRFSRSTMMRWRRAWEREVRSIGVTTVSRMQGAAAERRKQGECPGRRLLGEPGIETAKANERDGDRGAEARNRLVHHVVDRKIRARVVDAEAQSPIVDDIGEHSRRRNRETGVEQDHEYLDAGEPHGARGADRYRGEQQYGQRAARGAGSPGTLLAVASAQEAPQRHGERAER